MTNVNLLDSVLIRKIALDFAKATELAVVVVNINGDEISERFNFSLFCQKMRQNPDGYQRCRLSDRRGGLKASSDNKPCVYRCHAGLVDFSIPLIIEGHLVGFVLCGQVRLTQDDDLDNIQNVDRKWEYDHDLKLDYERIPVVDFQKIQASSELLKLIVDNCIHKHINLFVVDDSETGSDSDADKGRMPIHSNDAKIKKALRYIDNHFCEDLRLEDVASHVYLSPYYFSKIFKKYRGVGFNAYLNKQRMNHARKMLQHSDLSVALIAKNLGFSQTSYFCKVFRKDCDMTPQEYREKYNNEEILY